MEKILKRILIVLWCIFALIFIAIKIADVKFGTLRNWVSDTANIGLLVLSILSLLFIIITSVINKKSIRKKVVFIVLLSISIVVNTSMLILASSLLWGKRTESVESINGKKYVVITYDGFGGKESIYEYQNYFFRGDTTVNNILEEIN